MFNTFLKFFIKNIFIDGPQHQEQGYFNAADSQTELLEVR